MRESKSLSLQMQFQLTPFANPSEILSWDMSKIVKPTESDEKVCFALFAFKFKFSTSAKFFRGETNYTSFLSHVELTRRSENFTKWPPHSWSSQQGGHCIFVCKFQ